MNNKQLPKWVRYRAASYLRGRGLSLGVPSLIDGPLFPILAHEGTTYDIRVGTEPTTTVVNNDLGAFTDNYFDHIVVTAKHNNQSELEQKLRLGGHLVIIGHGHPTAGTWQAKEDVTEGDITVKIYKKVAGQSYKILPIKPKAEKRAVIARYGAIGDALQLTPVIHQLKDEGYHVTLNISPYTVDIYKHNPFVDNIVVQERNVIPNPDLGPYWEYWAKEYDRYINFSESIEGKLLKVEGRTDFYTPKAWRESVCNINYHDQHMKLAGITESKYVLPEFYYSRAEEKDLLHDLAYLKNKFVVMWALKGSSYHKHYAYYPEVAREWLEEHPDSYILQVGGPESIPLQIKHARAIPLSGGWPIRKSILATKYVDAVIGPESAITNAASCWDTPKIVLLSHSSPYNLTHYWKNVTTIMPDTAQAACYPCHQLHYTAESCPLVEVDINDRTVPSTPVCTTAVHPTKIYDSLEVLYLRWKNSQC